MDHSGFTRRAALGVGAAGLCTALVGARTPAALAVPEVDALELEVVVDAATFGPFLPDLRRPGIVVRYAGTGDAATAPRMSARPLLAEFGLSILARSRRGAERRRVLVDFGYSAATLANNLTQLGIDASLIDATVLSHGHLDHYGGFPGLYGRVRPPRPVPLLVGGEEAFCERVAMVGTPPPLMGTLDRAALARAGLTVAIAPEPALVAGHGFTTGTIPLASVERAAIPTRMRPGAGCRRDALSPAKQGLAELPDDGEHELATAYVVRGLGLVVIASCSHRGVINSVRRAQAVSGVDRVHAVIGGFHLVRPRTEAEAKQTAEAFRAIDPAWLIPMHCTGEAFITEAARLMPGKVIRPYVGTSFTFAAAGPA